MRLPGINSIRPPDAAAIEPSRRRRIAVAATVACLTAAPGAALLIAAYPVQGATAEASVAAEDVQVLLTEPAEISPGAPLFTLPWGEGPGQVGLLHRPDHESRGPEAFAVAPDGRLAVLDSVNNRILLLTTTGDTSATIALDLAAPRFLAADDNNVFVLDADDDLRLLSYSWQGEPLSDVSVGPFEDPVTALLVSDQGEALIETNHEHVAAPPDLGRGRPAGPGTRGRPAKAGGAGRSLSARMGPGGRPQVEDSDLGRGQHRGWSVAVRGRDRMIDHVVSLDSDDRGGVILGVRLTTVPSDDDTAVAASTTGTDPASLLLSRLDDPSRTLLLRDGERAYLGPPYVVAPSGLIYQPLATDEGYCMVTHTLPAAPVVPDALVVPAAPALPEAPVEVTP